MEQETKQATEAKPGAKTTEFWQTVIVGVIAMLLTAFGLWKGSDGIAALGTILMSTSQGAYSVSRGLAKQKKEAP